MVHDSKVSRFAREFFGQWLGYRDFLTQESVNRTAFPTFDDALKQAMFEEPTRLVTHLIQNDRSIIDVISCMVPAMAMRPSASRGGSMASVTSSQKLLRSGCRTTAPPVLRRPRRPSRPHRRRARASHDRRHLRRREAGSSSGAADADRNQTARTTSARFDSVR